MMDRCWLPEPLTAGYYYDYWPTASTTSNHPRKKQRYDGTRWITLADGANAVLADGSVRWMNLQNPGRSLVSQYHSDYYHTFYVESDL